jgi:predicted nucleic acid-binding protein
MTEESIIIDTGPLIAFFNKADYYHDWALMQFSRLRPPFRTCEAVISEVAYLLRRTKSGVQNLFTLIERDLLIVSFDLQGEYAAVKTLMKKYDDIPMSVADGCLVRMSEQISNSVIFTLDSDFRIYKKHVRNVIPLIFPAK